MYYPGKMTNHLVCPGLLGSLGAGLSVLKLGLPAPGKSLLFAWAQGFPRMQLFVLKWRTFSVNQDDWPPYILIITLVLARAFLVVVLGTEVNIKGNLV